MNIATIIGARPQFIKASQVSEIINISESFNEIIINTGQHYDKDMSNIFFNQFKYVKPKYNLNINQIWYGQMIEKMVSSLSKILLTEKVEGVIVYGDTNSTLAGSIAAKNNLPVFHIEAGLRCNNRKMIEESNRIITDHLSTLLFCPTKNSVKNLVKENLCDGVVFSGDVMYDSF